MDDARTALANAERADHVIAALMAHGVRQFFVCPGSRSTPLVLALARADATAQVFLDERVACFAAVGVARMGAVAAVLTTSGTAVANLLPGLCEAHAAELPLVALTADRPRSAIHTGANQTLDQPPLLAGAVKATLDIDVDGEGAPSVAPLDVRLHDVLQHLLGAARGPVHINARFNKPLEPPDAYRRLPLPVTAPSTHAALHTSLPRQVIDAIASARAGVIVSAAVRREQRAGVRALCRAIGWPVLWDVGSGGTPAGALSIASLRSPLARARLRADCVLWLGGSSTEEAAYSWLAQLAAPVHQLTDGAHMRDPQRVMTTRHVVDFGALALPPLARSRLTDAVVDLHGARRSAWHHARQAHDLSEPAVAHAVTQHVTAAEVLVLGNSMPVRDVERYGSIADGVDVVCNRGVSGIDGTLATALGAARHSRRPVTVLLGDLTALHDLSGMFAVATATDVDVRIIVINNDGGAIFSFLPVRNTPDFEKFFGTPHGRAVAPIADAMGVTAHAPTTLQELETLLSAPVRGVELIEVGTNRDTNVDTHRALDAAFETALQTTTVFFHGVFGGAADWDGVRSALHARRPHATAAIDLVATQAHDDKPNNAVAATAARIAELGVSDVVLCGYSMGARLALNIALQRPSWLRALVLESPHPGIRDPAQRRERLEQDRTLAAQVARDPAAAIRAFYQRPVFAGFRALPDAVARIEAKIARAQQHPDQCAHTLLTLSLGAQLPMWDQLALIDVPVLVVTGANDAAYVDIGTQLATLMPRATHVTVPRAGHNVHDEAPDAFVDAVSAFVANVAQRPSVQFDTSSTSKGSN